MRTKAAFVILALLPLITMSFFSCRIHTGNSSKDDPNAFWVNHIDYVFSELMRNSSEILEVSNITTRSLKIDTLEFNRVIQFLGVLSYRINKTEVELLEIEPNKLDILPSNYVIPYNPCEKNPSMMCPCELRAGSGLYRFMTTRGQTSATISRTNSNQNSSSPSSFSSYQIAPPSYQLFTNMSLIIEGNEEKLDLISIPFNNLIYDLYTIDISKYPQLSTRADSRIKFSYKLSSTDSTSKDFNIKYDFLRNSENSGKVLQIFFE